MQEMPSADIFTKISDVSEKNRLFRDLAAARGEIHAKRPEPSADVLILMGFDFGDQTLSCKITGATHPLHSDGDLVLTFFIGGEKYFFMGHYRVVGENILLKTTEPLFHLQRRNDYRIRIPASYKTLFEVVAINGNTKKMSIPVTDLSGGGCRLVINTQTLKLNVGDELRGHLFLPDREPIQLTGSIRHKKEEVHSKNNIAYGIQFVGLSEMVKNRIIAVVMDLYRELFIGRS
jgi:c-di-GMP-binding flagellar brake protein YcgR